MSVVNEYIGYNGICERTFVNGELKYYLDYTVRYDIYDKHTTFKSDANRVYIRFEYDTENFDPQLYGSDFTKLLENPNFSKKKNQTFNGLYCISGHIEFCDNPELGMLVIKNGWMCYYYGGEFYKVFKMHFCTEEDIKKDKLFFLTNSYIQ